MLWPLRAEFDAVIAALTARAVSLRQTLMPPVDHAAAALSEGWIHVPSGPLAALTAENRAACKVLEGFLEEYLSTPVSICCNREDEPKCCFELATQNAERRASH